MIRDCLHALQPSLPHLTRSSLQRCLQRHGISQLPQVEGEVSAKRKFKVYPIGFFHIDIAEVRTERGKLSLLVAIDRTSKVAFVEVHEKVARRTAADFLRHLIAAVPYKVHTVLTDNGRTQLYFVRLLGLHTSHTFRSEAVERDAFPLAMVDGFGRTEALIDELERMLA